jgi:tetratricopeptide (TPR) repeat protein
VEDGLATIDLGSADGLGKGAMVEVYRHHTLKDPVGTLRLVTVFREQARGNVEESDFKAQYAVRVPDSAHLEALLQQADNLHAAGDLRQAQHAAAHASTWAKTARVRRFDKARALRSLAGLDYQTGDAAGAETHYRAALELLSADPQVSAEDISEVQNDLAALAVLRGDYDSAQKILDANGVLVLNQKSRAEHYNNLGVLAEAHGDRQQAESFYGRALEALSQNSSNSRKVVEANLTRVKGLR